MSLKNFINSCMLRKMKPAHNPMSRPLLLVFEAHSTAERALNKAIYPFLLRRSKPYPKLGNNAITRTPPVSTRTKQAASFLRDSLFLLVTQMDRLDPS
ncbi:MAG: hypothetical protein WAX00_06725, partial [Trichococcus flocculiformis]